MELFGAKLQCEAAMKYYKGTPKQGYGRNRKKAFKLFLEAAEAGLVEAMVKVSEMYFDGEGCNINLVEAVKWMERAASKGNVEAQYRIGSHYSNKRDYGLGCYWLEKAASQGHVEAMFMLGEYYVNGPISQPEQAIKWLSKPALSNNPDAQYLLARAYDDKERKDMFEESLVELEDEIDDPNFNYEEFSKKRDEYIKNHPYSNKVNNLYKKALQLYEEKACFGNWRCVLETAKMYLYGVGCETNKEKAFDYYYRLAHQQEGEQNGDCNEVYRIRAIINLAKMYETGIGCEKNLEKRNELIQKNEIDEEWFKSYVIR